MTVRGRGQSAPAFTMRLGEGIGRHAPAKQRTPLDLGAGAQYHPTMLAGFARRVLPGPLRLRGLPERIGWPHNLIVDPCLFLPYGPSARILSGIWRRPACRSIACPGEWSRFRHDFENLDGLLQAPQMQDRLFARRMHTTCLSWSRLRDLSRWDRPHSWPPWLKLKGLDKLQRRLDEGRRVVVVNSHLGAFQCVPVVLARLGRRVASVECADVFPILKVKRPDGLTVLPTAAAFLARPALLAKRFLQAQGLVCLAADGYNGLSGLVLPFFGRQRRFASGFAELAVDCGALAIPVLAPVDERGRVELEFLDPLEEEVPLPGSGTTARRPRVESLIRRYARLLEDSWREHPGNIYNFGFFAALPSGGGE
jgi:lauroyl/myristoyl acyltransferase